MPRYAMIGGAAFFFFILPENIVRDIVKKDG